MRKTLIHAGVTVGLYACFVAVIGCFGPDFSQAQILCSAEKPDCPPDYVCAAPYCVPAATAERADLAFPSDGGADLASVPDLAMPPSGCAAKNGSPVGKAWACPGKWGNAQGTKAAALCGSGYKLCTNANPAISAFELQSCRNLKGFYLADVMGSRQQPAQPVCSTAYAQRVFYGCGEAARGSDFATVCGWFSQAMDCGDNRTGVRCPAVPAGTIEQTWNDIGTDGVLCCPWP